MQVVLMLRVTAVHRVLERLGVLVEVSCIWTLGVRRVGRPLLVAALGGHARHDTRGRASGPVMRTTAVGGAT
jgi:hypothetical protein